LEEFFFDGVGAVASVFSPMVLGPAGGFSIRSGFQQCNPLSIDNEYRIPALTKNLLILIFCIKGQIMNPARINRPLSMQQRAQVFALCLCVLASGILAQNGNIRGRVIDINGHPVAGATVQLLKNHGFDSTDNDGTFSITSNVGNITAVSAIDHGILTFALKNNRLVFENSLSSGFAFELVSLEGRRVYALKQPDLPAGKHIFSCPLDGIAAGLYIAHISYAGNQVSKAVAWLPKSRWQYAATVGWQSLPGYYGKMAVAADTLMVYKRGYRSFYVPLQTSDVNLNDLTMSADTGHKEKYIVFFRDSLTEILPPTSGWEFDPVKKTFTKKYDFAPSSWAPDLLLDAVTPEYVRHQVNNSNLYDVTLYKIDYCTWQVDTVLQSEQIHGLGSTPEKVFLYTDKGWVILDRQSGRLDPMESFNMIVQFHDLWLVKHNNPDTAYLFSPAENRIKTTLVSSTQFGTWDRYWMSDDGRYLAQSKAISGNVPFGNAVSVKSQIVLFSLDSDSSCRFPINIYCAAGSGVPVIYYSLRCWFSNDGGLNYVSALREGDTLKSPSDSAMVDGCELVSIYLQTLTPTSGPATAAMFAPQFTPPFLPPYLDSLRGKLYYEDQVIENFLNRFGIITNAREYGLSFDGKRFLGRFGIGESSVANNAFIYGDMENRWIERLPDPGQHLFRLYSEIHLYGIADTCGGTVL
jgi:hypothetical protein